MRAGVIGMLLVGALFWQGTAAAQVYTCIAEDGSRVFSDERCGPDAKVVPGISSKKRPPAAARPASKPVPEQKSAAELEQLMKQCDAGEVRACNQWTLGGGPALLREKERQAELECEGGSLAACEERYCREGLNADCRARVLRTAKLAGEIWYLRNEGARQPDGVTRYDIRCVPEGASQSKDITVTCASLPGPNRCYLSDPGKGFPRLDRAAAQHCAS
jgi:Domain of unknown function (DUF4124)